MEIQIRLLRLKTAAAAKLLKCLVQKRLSFLIAFHTDASTDPEPPEALGTLINLRALIQCLQRFLIVTCHKLGTLMIS